jgi:hypothetical protein
MQVRKVAVVATGALATAAAMGSPAFAAASQGSPEVAPAITGLLNLEGAQQASDETMRDLAEYWLTAHPEQGTPPWAQEPPQILSVGSGSAVSALSWQICGSSVVAGVGATIPIASPNTVLGDCTNANIGIEGNGGDDALFSILDNSAVSLVPWQICGSSVVAGVGLTAPVASPNTVKGDCTNGNISIDTTEEVDPGYYPYPVDSAAPAGGGDHYYGESQESQEEGYYHPNQNGTQPWEQEPPQILSVASGSVASALSWQVCGSSVVAGVGATVPIASPNTVIGDCTNGNISINSNG